MQLTDAETRGGQRRDLPACAVGTFLPHKNSVALRNRISIPTILGSTRTWPRASVKNMTQQVQHTAAGEGFELTVPDAVLTIKIDAGHTDGRYELFEVDAPRGPATPLHRTGWDKAYYMLYGRMIVQVDDEGYDVGPGSSVTIPAGALHTFTVLSPSAKFLAVSLTDAMGRFQADLAAAVPRGRPIEEATEEIQRVLSRHDVTVEGLEAHR